MFYHDYRLHIEATMSHKVIHLEAQAHHKSGSKTHDRSHNHRAHTHCASGVVLAISRRCRVGRAIFLSSVALLLLDLDVVHITSFVAGTLGILLEANIGTVVQGIASVTNGNNLNASDVSVLGLDVRGKLKLVNEESAWVCGIEELWGKGDVEVGGVLAEAEVDEDVGPFVVKIKGESATVEGPVSEVLLVEVNTSTYCLLAEYAIERYEMSYRVAPTGCSAPRPPH